MSGLYWPVVALVVSGAGCLEYGRRKAVQALRLAQAKCADLESQLAGRQASYNAAELRYKLLFNDVSAAIIITRFSGEIVAANTAMVRLLGFESEDDLREHNASELYVDPAVREAEMKHLSTDPHNHNREFPLRRKDGQSHQGARDGARSSGRKRGVLVGRRDIHRRYRVTSRGGAV